MSTESHNPLPLDPTYAVLAAHVRAEHPETEVRGDLEHLSRLHREAHGQES